MLPQTIDKSIWLEYPQLSQDIVALLWGSSVSALAQHQNSMTGMSIQGASAARGLNVPFFCFGRVHADVFLMEQGGSTEILYALHPLHHSTPEAIRPDVCPRKPGQNGPASNI